MAKDAANDISYYLLLDEGHLNDLAAIRYWSNLKIAFNEGKVWVKDLDYAQVNSAEVKSIPYKTVFYATEGKLFLQHSRLPDRIVPSLLWTPAERALPIELPPFNHNFFGVNEKISVRIIPSENEATAMAMLTDLDVLEVFMQSAAAVRSAKIKWALLNNSKVFLMGTPLLPISGNVYWQRGNFILPAGYDLDLFLLTEVLNNKIDPEKEAWVVWNTDGTYFLLEKNDLQPLSLSSLRLSTNELLAPKKN